MSERVCGLRFSEKTESDEFDADVSNTPRDIYTFQSWVFRFDDMMVVSDAIRVSLGQRSGKATREYILNTQEP